MEQKSPETKYIEPHFIYKFEENEKKIQRKIIVLLIIPLINLYFIIFVPQLQYQQSKHLINLDQTLFHLTIKARQLCNIYQTLSDRTKRHQLDLATFSSYLKIKKELYENNNSLDTLANATSTIYTLIEDRQRYNTPQEFLEDYNNKFFSDDSNKISFKILEKIENTKRENDPIYDLYKLSQLDSAIINFDLFDYYKKEDYLIKKSQQSSKSEQELLEMLPTFSIFERYPIPDYGNIKYLSRYRSVVSIINPPFNVKTLNDLLKLQDYLLANYGESLNKKTNQMEIVTPYLKTNIELFVLIVLSPFISLFLIVGIKNNTQILKRIFNDIFAQSEISAIKLAHFSTNILFHKSLIISVVNNIPYLKNLTNKYEKIPYIIRTLMWLGYLFFPLIYIVFILFKKSYEKGDAFLFYGYYLGFEQFSLYMLIIISICIICLLVAFYNIYKTFKIIFENFHEVHNDD